MLKWILSQWMDVHIDAIVLGDGGCDNDTSLRRQRAVNLLTGQATQSPTGGSGRFRSGDGERDGIRLNNAHACV